MPFSNRLKGTVTQALLRAVLQDCGYRIVPLGIEEVLREITVLQKEEYNALNLPPMFRHLPDFFVAQQDMKRTWFVEVKYRKAWNKSVADSLGKQLFSQVQTWSPLHLMVFLGTAGKQKDKENLASSWMGIVRLVIENGELTMTQLDGKPYAKWVDVTWGRFHRIQDFFPSLSDTSKYNQQTLQQIRQILPQLAVLDKFEVGEDKTVKE